MKVLWYKRTKTFQDVMFLENVGLSKDFKKIIIICIIRYVIYCRLDTFCQEQMLKYFNDRLFLLNVLHHKAG